MKISKQTHSPLVEFKVTDANVAELVEFLRMQPLPFACHFGDDACQQYVLTSQDERGAFCCGLLEGARLARLQAAKPKAN